MQLIVGTGSTVLTAECASASWNPSGATTPSGYLLHGGPAPGLSTLFLNGCESGAANSRGITLEVPMVTAATTYSSGAVTYTDAQGAQWTSPQSELDITALGAVGQPITGFFSAGLIHPPSQTVLQVQVNFQVCRLQDEDVP